ncbi:MAG: flagellar hook-length control protein FliK [Nitrospirae bacterium]|nr:flagellar hook-length control protein FliK [Nitrospirota bacterium]
MNLANMPDINTIPQVNSAAVPSSDGNTQSCKPCESRFASIVNKEINSHEAGNKSDNLSGSAHGNELNSRSEQAGNTSDLNISANSPQNKSDKSGKESVSEVQGKKGSKIDKLLLNMIGSSVTANTNGLQVSLINEIADPAITEEALQQLISQQEQNIPVEKGLLANLIKQIKDQEITEEAPQQLINQQDQNIPAEKGLKVGALLYSMTNNVVNPTGDSHADLINQSNSDTKTKGETFTGEIKGSPEHGLKTGTLLSGTKIETPLRDLIKEGTGGFSAEKSLSAFAQNENNKTASDSGKLSVVEKLMEHFDKNNKNELNHLKSAKVQQDITGSGLTENNNNSKNIQGGLSLEVVKEISKAEGFKNITDNSVKMEKIESTSDNTNLLNHSGIKLDSSKLAEAISSGNASRPPGANQALDNIVYVIKGNSKLGVSVEHDILGKLNINLSMEKGMLNVHINTSGKIAREFIENNINYIVDSLAKDGLSVGGFSVGLKNRNDHEENVFIMNNKQESQEKQVINEKTKISAISGLVSVFA